MHFPFEPYTCIPPDVDVYHPLNIYPVFVGFNALTSLFWVDEYTTFFVSSCIVPPFALNVIVYSSSFHTAYNVILLPFCDERFTTDSLFEYCFEPVACVDHPTNSNPVLSNPFSVNFLASSYVWELCGVEPLVLPFPLYVIVYVIGVHCAYNVISSVYTHWLLLFQKVFEFALLLPLFLYTCIPSVLSVYQPLNIYPVFVGFNELTLLFFVELYTTSFVFSVIFPPFGSNVIVYVFSFQRAYNFSEFNVYIHFPSSSQ